MLDLNKLNVFLHAAQTLNFSQTAHMLHISQPTVSKHISELEREFEVALFQREGGKLKLTSAGKTLVPWARQLVHQSLDLHETMISMKEDIVGHLQIACSTTAGKYILPQIAGRFRRHHPGVSISILTCTQEKASLNLLESEADFGAVSVEINSDQLECQEFFTDHIVMIVPQKHPWARRQSVEPSELLEVPFINREPTSGTRRALLSELARHDVTLDDLDVFLEVGNAEAIVAAVSSNLGVSFVSRLSSAYARACGAVVEVPVEGIELQRRLCIARLTMTPPPNRAQEAFWTFIHNPENDDLFALSEM
jgi:LysR family transcriptional regulator, low CO2-responsive transcriptional regulator